MSKRRRTLGERIEDTVARIILDEINIRTQRVRCAMMSHRGSRIGSFTIAQGMSGLEVVAGPRPTTVEREALLRFAGRKLKEQATATRPRTLKLTVCE